MALIVRRMRGGVLWVPPVTGLTTGVGTNFPWGFHPSMAGHLWIGVKKFRLIYAVDYGGGMTFGGDHVIDRPSPYGRAVGIQSNLLPVDTAGQQFFLTRDNGGGDSVELTMFQATVKTGSQFFPGIYALLGGSVTSYTPGWPTVGAFTMSDLGLTTPLYSLTALTASIDLRVDTLF